MLILLLLLFYIPIIILLLNSKTSLAVPYNNIFKLPVFMIMPVLPWDIIQSLNIFRFYHIGIPDIISMLNGIFWSIILFTALIKLRNNKTIKLFAFIYLLSPILIMTISFLFIRIAALRSFTIFSPLFFLILAVYIEKLNKVPKITIFIILLLSSILFYYFTTFSTLTTLSKIYKNFSKNDVIVYNDVTNYLQAKIYKPHGQHLLIYPGYLDSNAYKALEINLTKLQNIPKSKRIWFYKVETGWPPFERQANQLEKYLQNKNHEIKRINLNNTTLILYE